MKNCFVLLFLCITACTSSSITKSYTITEAAISETVVRYHFAKERYFAEGVFLLIKNSDPTPDMLLRLSDLETQVLPGSQYITGQRPTLFEITSIKYETSLAIVEAYQMYNPFLFMRYEFILIRRDGKWVVNEAYEIII